MKSLGNTHLGFKVPEADTLRFDAHEYKYKLYIFTLSYTNWNYRNGVQAEPSGDGPNVQLIAEVIWGRFIIVCQTEIFFETLNFLFSNFFQNKIISGINWNGTWNDGNGNFQFTCYTDPTKG